MCTRFRHLSKQSSSPWPTSVISVSASPDSNKFWLLYCPPVFYKFKPQGMGALGTPTWLNQELLHLISRPSRSPLVVSDFNHPGYYIDPTTCRMYPLSAREDKNLSELTFMVIVGMITTVRLLQWLLAHSDSRKIDDTHPRWSLPISESYTPSCIPVHHFWIPKIISQPPHMNLSGSGSVVDIIEWEQAQNEEVWWRTWRSVIIWRKLENNFSHTITRRTHTISCHVGSGFTFPGSIKFLILLTNSRIIPCYPHSYFFIGSWGGCGFQAWPCRCRSRKVDKLGKG